MIMPPATQRRLFAAFIVLKGLWILGNQRIDSGINRAGVVD